MNYIPTTEDIQNTLLNNEKLTKKQKIFIIEYVNNGFNGTQAVIKAGYSENVANQQASENLSKPYIKQAIKDYLDEVLGQYKDTLEYEIIQEYKLRAFYDPKQIVNDDGKLVKPLKYLGKLSRCIDGIEKTYNRLGNEIIKIKLANKENALEKLATYMKMLRQQIDLPDTVKLIISKEDANII